MTEYLLDTCIVIEMIRGNEKTKLWLTELNPDDKILISGWTILEMLKDQKSKRDMENCVKKFAQYKFLWANPEKCDDIPELLIKYFHSNNGKRGNCIFDCLIYETAKSNNNPIIVTRDGDFNFVNDIEVLNLQNNNKYKIEYLTASQ